jgi:hypothetical protein
MLRRVADYSSIIADATTRHGIRVRRWRRNMSGCAWQVTHRTGRIDRWIESPMPKTPISLSIFLHEVGHHAVGFGRFRKRCEEEYYVWLWAIDQMRKLGVEPDARVLRRFELSMRYAVSKAIRRGIRDLPSDLARFAMPIPVAA